MRVDALDSLRPPPYIFACCKRSKTGGRNGLEMRLASVKVRVTTGAREQIPLIFFSCSCFFNLNVVVVVVVLLLLSDLINHSLVSWPGVIVLANIWDEPE